MKRALPAPPPSAHDVARRAGVSQAAVSRAFTPGASIASATKARVMEAARALCYSPNRVARSLITGQTGIIGVVIGNANYPFFLAALDLLSTRLSKAGRFLLTYTAPAPEDANQQVERLLEYRVDGIVLIGVTISDALISQCHAKNVRVVSFIRPTTPILGGASVVGENIPGAAAIARHLLEQGYRNLAIMVGAPEASSSREREAGFVDYLASQGLPPPGRVIGHFRRLPAMDAARSLLSAPDRPDAIYCVNDDMAFAAIEVARHEYGIDVGPELGIAGFDDVELASWPSFDLTTYSLPADTMMDQVVHILLDPDADTGGVVTVRGELRIRGSTDRRSTNDQKKR